MYKKKILYTQVVLRDQFIRSLFFHLYTFGLVDDEELIDPEQGLYIFNLYSFLNTSLSKHLIHENQLKHLSLILIINWPAIETPVIVKYYDGVFYIAIDCYDYDTDRHQDVILINKECPYNQFNKYQVCYNYIYEIIDTMGFNPETRIVQSNLIYSLTTTIDYRNNIPYPTKLLNLNTFLTNISTSVELNHTLNPGWNCNIESYENKEMNTTEYLSTRNNKLENYSSYWIAVSTNKSWVITDLEFISGVKNINF